MSTKRDAIVSTSHVGPPASIHVLKFGSSVLADDDAFPDVVQEIYRYVRAGQKVIAVVSAVGTTTTALLDRARFVSEQPEEEGVAALLRTGELASVALLSLHLSRAGVPHRCLDGATLGLMTSGPRLDGVPESVSVEQMQATLCNTPVIVMPGFIGQCVEGRPTLLGRGGSDLTALFVASVLDAPCLLYKDVDGIYEWDPAYSVAPPRRFSTLTWEQALEVGGPVVQPKAVSFARERALDFEVRAIGGCGGTRVGACDSQLIEPVSQRPLRIILLGLGTVGFGVYQRLLRHADVFDVVGIGVRDVEKHAHHVPRELLSSDIDALLRRSADVVLSLVGGTGAAIDWISRSLSAGRHVITANKDAIAADGPRLRSMARKRGVQLLYSASVGGVLPAIESLSRLSESHQIVSLSGVLNGTTNFLLGRLSQGDSFDAALQEAQRRGFAEADPSNDLSGLDAVYKASILAWHGFGASLSPESISRIGIDALHPDWIVEALRQGQTYRLVADIWRDHQGIHANVLPKVLPLEHPLARTMGVDNCIIVTLSNGVVHEISGKGAGRWPTTTSVLADLSALTRVTSRIAVPCLVSHCAA